MVYDNGKYEIFTPPKQCVQCECRDGKMTCARIDSEKICPPLTCSPSEQISVPGECCKYCPGTELLKMNIRLLSLSSIL